MNFRKLLTYLTVGTAAVIPFAGAQNPTILQGSYISNVFGNSNFVKNPNAQTNVANVTNATRSTTTPLVATSEFNLSLDAGQNATWTLRTFDAGMKGQNCEARFSYRGFATATTTAEIVQNSLVVAQLVLTPSTDPRIASINFPCGDLANATTFRIAQTTANMTGTNEIGGVYTGLATNQANVAQAEFVGATELASCTTPHTVTSTTFANLSSPTCTRNNFGAATTSTNDFSVTIPNAKPGWYFVKWNGIPYADAGSNNSCYWALKEDTQGYIGGATFANSPTGFASAIGASQLTMDLNTTTTATRTFRVVGKSATGACKVDAGSVINSTVISVFRFPTSSELVVTPERQNTFAGLKGTFSGFSNAVTTASWTKLTAGATLTRTAYGKAKVETNDDLSITIDNLPVGAYQISATGNFFAKSSASGVTTNCVFAIADTATGGPQIAATGVDSTGDANLAIQYINGQTLQGIYNNTSVASRTFFLQAYRPGGGGECGVYGDTLRAVTITISPLDQPSNSALYVEGPVRGSNTNTAIPTNSIGGKVIDASLTKTTTALGTWQVATGNFGTPPAGSYLMMMTSVGNATAGLTGTGSIINESGASVTPVTCQLNAINSTANGTVIGRVCYYTTDGTKTLYAWAQSTGAGTAVDTQLILVRLN